MHCRAPDNQIELVSRRTVVGGGRGRRGAVRGSYYICNSEIITFCFLIPQSSFDVCLVNMQYLPTSAASRKRPNRISNWQYSHTTPKAAKPESPHRPHPYLNKHLHSLTYTAKPYIPKLTWVKPGTPLANSTTLTIEGVMASANCCHDSGSADRRSVETPSLNSDWK